MINSYSFGRFVVDGKEYKHDIKIINGEVSFWQNHSLNINDVRDAIEAKPEILIMGTGASGVVEVSQDIIDAVESKGIKLIILKTAEACNKYNELTKQEKKIAAILHSTC